MTPKKAEMILDQLGVEYEKVTMSHTLIVKLKDGSRISFKKLLREHEKTVSAEVTDLLFTPHPEEKPVDNEVTRADTEIIKKPSRKKR